MICIGITENQGVIGKQEMGHDQPLSSSSSSSRFEARNKAPISCTWQQLAKSFHGKKEKIGGKRVALSQSSRATKEAWRAPIDEDWEGSRRVAPFHPINPSMPKSHLGHHIHKKVPIDMVKSLLDIHLKKEARRVVFQPRIN